MEHDTTGPEPAGVKREDEGVEPEVDVAARLRELEEEAEKLRAQLQGRQEESPEEEPNDETPDESEPVAAPAAHAEHETPPVTTPVAQAEAENFLRQAKVAKMRGQTREAMDFMMEAEKVAPNFPPVLEALGDELAAKNRWKDAQSVYGRAAKLAPSNVGLERKYAQAVLKASIPVEALFLGDSRSLIEESGNAKMAAVMSFFLPGLGQLVLGEIGKGIGFLACWVGAWVVALLIPNGFSGFIAAASGKTQPEPNFVLVPLFLAFVVLFLSVQDAGSRAKTAKKRDLDRPKPPVDLPFE